jgi:hypothetical protein
MSNDPAMDLLAQAEREVKASKEFIAWIREKAE